MTLGDLVNWLIVIPGHPKSIDAQLAQVAIDFQITVAESDVRKLGDLDLLNSDWLLCAIGRVRNSDWLLCAICRWWRMGEGDGAR